MSEVKSARIFLRDLQDIRESTDYNINALIEYVGSDRRAIIEKCKEAVINSQEYFIMDKPGQKMQLQADILQSLDSVLSEIDKEE